jgi:hypothetical protein
MSAAITFAHAVAPPASLTKAIIVRNGAIIDVKPSRNATIFEFTEQPIHDLDSLGAAVEVAAGRGDIAVRAQPKAKRGRRAIYDDPQKGPAGLTVVPRQWCAFDWDGIPIEEGVDPLRDSEVSVRLALRRLPPAFRDVSCLWQISASAGFKPGFRLRSWHWLDHPVTGSELKIWLAPAIKRELVDPATLVEAQPHYLTVRVIGGADLCPQRFGILRLAREEVPVPDIEDIRRRQEQREQDQRYAAQQPERRAGGRFDPEPAGDDGRRRIDDCLAAIRSASEGARHPTYTREAARAKALCERYGIEWGPVRTSLMEAYESTLTATEVRQRKRSSTEGVVTWLEARSSCR